jgi:N-acetylmuramoyl-L-alanine amidase
MKLIRLAFVAGLMLTAHLSAQVTGLAGWDIFLDPGHSMTENMGIHGYSEAEKNLRVARHLRNLLLTTTDIDAVFMCRTTDAEDVPLTQRDDLAENAYGLGQPASWYHSIHSNAGAESTNNTLFLWGQNISGVEKPWAPGGQAMSDIMVVHLTNGMRIPTIGSIGDCSFYTWSNWCNENENRPYLFVNRETDMPSELSEAGHHTNSMQNQRNMSYLWKRLEAYTFYWSILEYHEIARPPVSILTGIIRDLELGTAVNGAVASAGEVMDTTNTYASLFHNYSPDPDQLHNGFYFLENVPGDNVELVISAPGYYPDTLQVAMVDNFFTFRDVNLVYALPPKVKSSTPAQGDSLFPAWDPIKIYFSRPMNRTSVEANFQSPGGIGGTFSWTDDSRRLTFLPESLEFLTQYSLTISGDAVDAYDHPFDGNGDGTGGDDLVISFRTGPSDLTPPAILVGRLHPKNGAAGTEVWPLINITFDELIADNSVAADQVRLVRTGGYNVPGQIRHYQVREQSVLNFFPDEPLKGNTQHTIWVFPGLRDILGNELTAYKTYRFTTGTMTLDATNIDNFDGGVGNWWDPTTSGSTTGHAATGNSRAGHQTKVNLLTGSSQSMQLNYAWNTNATAWLIREYLSSGAPRDVHFDDSYIMQAYVFGDGSGNQLRFCVDDNVSELADSKHEVSPWYTIDWIGWKVVSWDMSIDGTGSWIGDNSLDGTLEFDSIQLTYVPGAAASGTIYFDDLRLVQERLFAVEGGGRQLPSQYKLHANYPNPFNPSTTITYEVPRVADVRLTVYNLLGQPVRTLKQGQVGPGRRTAIWDGRDDQGQLMASGVYIYALEAGDINLSRKMVLTK